MWFVHDTAVEPTQYNEIRVEYETTHYVLKFQWFQLLSLILLAEKIFFKFMIWIKALTHTQVQLDFSLSAVSSPQ